MISGSQPCARLPGSSKQDTAAAVALRRVRFRIPESTAKAIIYHLAEGDGSRRRLSESRSGIAPVMPQVQKQHKRMTHQTRKNGQRRRRRTAATPITSIVPVLLLLCLFNFVGGCSAFVAENMMSHFRPVPIIHASSSGDDGQGTTGLAEEEGSISTSSIDEPINSSSDDVPSTPCERICRYNANFYDGQICIGCYRDAYEISSWQVMTGQQKAWALLDAADRVPEGCDVVEEGNESGDVGTSSCDFSAAISKDELLRQAKYWENL